MNGHAPHFDVEDFADPAAALARAHEIYDLAVEHLRRGLQHYVDGADIGRHVRACYPLLRVRTDTVARADSRLSYGFVAGPGVFETTLTRPDLFADYYLEQFRLLVQNHGVALQVGSSTQPIPVHFALPEHDYLEGHLGPERRRLLRDHFDLPDLGAMDDGIANGTFEPGPGEPHPLALFTAPRVDYSLHRLRHYTGTRPAFFQNFVLFTNYQFYIDEFIRLGHELMADTASGHGYEAFVEPGNVLTRRVDLPPQAEDADGTPPPRLPQMPAYHLVRGDHAGITMVNIGVGPANAKTITDHPRALRHPADDAAQHALPVHRLPDRLPALARVDAVQEDLALALVLRLLSPAGLDGIRARAEALPKKRRTPLVRAFSTTVRRATATIDPTIAFLQGRDPTIAHRIASRTFLPEGPRFESLDAYRSTMDEGGDPLAWAFGALGVQDRARHLATLYLNELADVLREAVDARFEFVRYAESLAHEPAHLRAAGAGAGRRADAGRRTLRG
jgi:hypothetical protein